MATVPINDDLPLNAVTATGGQTTVDFDFWVEAQEDLKVYKNGVLLTLTTHYTVSGVQVAEGGAITLVTPATNGDVFVVLRDTPVDRISGFDNSFRSEALNLELSRLVAMVRERERDIDRSLHLAPYNTIAFDMAINPTSGDAGAFLALNSTYNGWTFTTANAFVLGASKVNYVATSDPTVGDDSGDGYSIGSRWINLTTDKEFICADATLGAAVWKETTAGATSHAALTGLGSDDHTQYHTDARALTWLGTRSTSDLIEGANLYYTDERVDDRVNALLVMGTGLSKSYNDGANTYTLNNTITDHSNLTGLTTGDPHTQYVAVSGRTMTGPLSFSGTANSGITVNSLTTAQRDALTPANGMIIYNTTTAKFQAYQAGAWTDVITASGASAATQAELEAGSSTTVFTSPGRQQYHPSTNKAWVSFNGTGTVAINASYNVTSITDNGTGNYTVNFTTSFSSANFATAGMAYVTAAGIGQISPSSKAAGSCTVRTWDEAAYADAVTCDVHFAGDQ